MKSTKDEKYLLTCSHAMSTSWGRTTRNSDSTWKSINHSKCQLTALLQRVLQGAHYK